MTETILHRLSNEPQTFFSLICQLVTRENLKDIAEADYGERADENYQRLIQIKQSAVVPSPLDWHLEEILRLCAHTSPGPAKGEVHVQREFACSTLILGAANPANQEKLFVETIPPRLATFTDSLFELDDRLVSEAIGFLAHCGARIYELNRSMELPPFFGLVLLIILSDIRCGRRDDRIWRELIDFVLAEDQRITEEGMIWSSMPVLGLSIHGNDQLLRRLVHDAFDAPGDHVPVAVRQDLRQLAEKIPPSRGKWR